MMGLGRAASYLDDVAGERVTQTSFSSLAHEITLDEHGQRMG